MCWKQAIILAAAIVTILSYPAVAVEFSFSLDQEATTSAGVYTPDGRMVRTLWSLKQSPAGKQTATWDGTDEFGRKLSPGDYEVRLTVGNGSYKSMGVIGNNGIGSSMQSATEDLRVDTATGHIFTANTWEEAGQDFKREDPDGKTVMDAQFRARNGMGGGPGGMPESITFDDRHLYVGIYTLRDEYEEKAGSTSGGQIIRKFDKDTGELASFTEAGAFIRIHYPDPEWESQWGHDTLRSMVVLGDVLIAVDEKFDRVLKYDKNAGKLLGEFAVKAPRHLALDNANRLWISHDNDKLSVFDINGNQLAGLTHRAGQIECMRLDNRGRLWLADQDAGQLQVYKIESLEKLTLEQTYGQKPQEGKLDPADLYTRIRFDVMPDGGYVLTQSPGHGCIESRFDSNGKLIWQQVGLEFCTTGTYQQKQPDLFISSLLNAYRLSDLAKGAWRFEGSLGSGKDIAGTQSSGNPRFVELGGKTFFYVLSGEQVIVFRYANGRLFPAMQMGLNSRVWKEDVLGKLEGKERSAIWFTWRDANGDAAIQREEVVKQTPTTRLGGYSIDVDEKGNLIFSNHQTSSVYEMPLAGFDENGIPRYEFASAREVIPTDSTFRGLRPMKAVRTPEGYYYVLAPADPSFYSTAGHSPRWELCWMGGWTVSKFDPTSRRLFTVALPDHCTGVDWVPNVGRTREQGFVTGQFTGKHLYHYSSDGLLLGTLTPEHETGWLDHNGSISINRNPEDGLVDVFAEESFRNRISWYRMDDRNVKTLSIPVKQAAVEGEKTSTETDLYAAIEAAKAMQKDKDFAGAARQFEEALEMAAPREAPFVRLLLAQALLSVPPRKTEALAHMEAVADEQGMDARKRADLLIEVAHQQTRMNLFDEALATLAKAGTIPVPRDRRYDYKLTLEAGRVYLAAGRYDEALAKAEDAMKLHADQDQDGRFLHAYWLKGDALTAAKRYSDAVAFHEGLRTFRIARVDLLSEIENRLAKVYTSSNEHAKAAAVLVAALQKYPSMPPYQKPGFILQTADCYFRAGDKQKAREYCRQLLDMPDCPSWARREVEGRMPRYEK